MSAKGLVWMAIVSWRFSMSKLVKTIWILTISTVSTEQGKNYHKLTNI